MKAIINFILAGLFIGCGGTTEGSGAASQAVRAVEVQQGPVLQGQRYLAEVVPDRTVRVLAQVPGAVSEMSVDPGVTVEEGSSLVRISAPDIAARISRVGAERERAERERDFACELLETDRVLASSGDLAPIQLDRSEKGCAAAELVVEAALAAEREAGVAGTRAVERAPFAGEVLVQLADEGQTVMPGTPLLQFGSRERVLRLRVPESDLTEIEYGARVVFERGSGRVVEIGAQAQGPGRLIEVLVEPDEALTHPPGTTQTATVVVAEREDTTSVPVAALTQDDAGTYVLVVEGDTLRRVGVETGPEQDGWIAIEPRLPERTRVVSEAPATLDLALPVLAVTP
jgi:RND family efflux transporter MFP subunit